MKPILEGEGVSHECLTLKELRLWVTANLEDFAEEDVRVFFKEIDCLEMAGKLDDCSFVFCERIQGSNPRLGRFKIITPTIVREVLHT